MELLKNCQQLLIDAPPVLNSVTFTNVVRMLSVMCANFPDLAITLLKNDIASTLLYLLTNSTIQQTHGDYNIQKKSTLHLVLRLRGGSDRSEMYCFGQGSSPSTRSSPSSTRSSPPSNRSSPHVFSFPMTQESKTSQESHNKLSKSPRSSHSSDRSSERLPLPVGEKRSLTQTPRKSIVSPTSEEEEKETDAKSKTPRKSSSFTAVGKKLPRMTISQEEVESSDTIAIAKENVPHNQQETATRGQTQPAKIRLKKTWKSSTQPSTAEIKSKTPRTSFSLAVDSSVLGLGLRDFNVNIERCIVPPNVVMCGTRLEKKFFPLPDNYNADQMHAAEWSVRKFLKTDLATEEAWQRQANKDIEPFNLMTRNQAIYGVAQISSFTPGALLESTKLVEGGHKIRPDIRLVMPNNHAYRKWRYPVAGLLDAVVAKPDREFYKAVTTCGVRKCFADGHVGKASDAIPFPIIKKKSPKPKKPKQFKIKLPAKQLKKREKPSRVSIEGKPSRVSMGGKAGTSGMSQPKPSSWKPQTQNLFDSDTD